MKAALLAVVLLAGCTTWPPKYRYQPNPVEVRIQPAGEDELAAALFSIRGFAERGEGHDLVVRMRLVNLSDIPFTTSPPDWRLSATGLEPFDVPRFAPDPIELAPGEEVTTELSFGLPPSWRDEKVDLRALNLAFALRSVEKVYHASANFERVVRERYATGFGYYPVWFGHPYFHHGYFVHHKSK